MVMIFLPQILPMGTRELVFNLLDAFILTLLTSIVVLPLLIRFRRLASDSELALNITSEGYWDLTIDGQIVNVNPGYCQMIGYTREQILSMRASDFVADISAEELSERFKGIIATGHEAFESIHRHRTGNIIYIEASVSFVNETQHFICFLRDVTERKVAETALKASAASLQTTLDNSPYLAWLKDSEGHYININKALADYIGLADVKDVLNKTDYDIWPKGLAEKYRIDDAEIMASRQKRYIDEQIYDGTKLHWIETFKTPIIDEAGNVIGTTGFSRDITDRKAVADEIHHIAFHDLLTQLPNRQLLMDRLKQALVSSVRMKQIGALLFLDLDHFKTLNDTLGHDFGDLLLQQVANRLVSCVRESDTVARLGGDEFVVLLENVSSSELEAASKAETVAEKILFTLTEPYKLHNVDYQITTSIGITLFGENKQSQEDIIKHADIAMYQAKKSGRNAMRFFDPKMQETINMRAEMERDLHQALNQNEFQLYYQVQVNSTGLAFGAEALIRWIHPQKGLIPPIEFIPLAEETGLILPIGRWVLETACMQIKSWESDSITRGLTISVNVSAKQFNQPDFVVQVQTTVQRYAINPTLLKLELTDSMLADDIGRSIINMVALQAVGVRFELDDFGTGYSSLQYLKQLPISQLKIDQSFVHDIANEISDRAIVQTIVAMAKSLNLEVIAEGVETQEQQQLLIENGCLRFQGYLFGRPLPIDQFEAELSKDDLH
jgi:diguanylate cyclase (GGDEF)-like protein/PAS domain S-box-containing protein